ncbi:MAG: hypothetical protein EOP42_07825 [Sphingobacteriaceae bacterium]|nr:MAG: hypothetical protein EOP42_07825 [Sphingobacteriaceae bacterium]
MDKFINLKEIVRGNALNIKVNIDSIVSYGETYQENTGSTVRLSGGFTIKVQESLVEIRKLVFDAQNNKSV